MNNISNYIYVSVYIAVMAFRNFVVSDGAKEASFIPRDPREFSYGMGSPSTSFNNNDVDAMVLEPTAIIEEVIPLNSEEVPLAIEAFPDVEILSSDDVPMTYAGTFGIADRVRERKGTEMKASKPPITRNLTYPLSYPELQRRRTPKIRLLLPYPLKIRMMKTFMVSAHYDLYTTTKLIESFKQLLIRQCAGLSTHEGTP